MTERSNVRDCKSRGLCLRGFESLSLHQKKVPGSSRVFLLEENGREHPKESLRSEACQWHFARQTSDGDWFAIRASLGPAYCRSNPSEMPATGEYFHCLKERDSRNLLRLVFVKINSPYFHTPTVFFGINFATGAAHC
jgi:hypothetical protein